jgi:hypothetical protein
MIFAAVLMAFVAVATGAKQKSAPEPAKPVHDPIKDVFSAADSLDVECRADIELSAIEQGKVPDAKLAEQTLEHLYDRRMGRSTTRSLKTRRRCTSRSKTCSCFRWRRSTTWID